MSVHYPELDDISVQKLTIIKTMMDNDPNYLDAEACPYSYQIVEKLKHLIVVTLHTEVRYSDGLEELDNMEDIDFEKESKILFHEMKRFKSGLSSDDTSEKTQTFRIMVTLIEKMIESQERASGIKQFNAFVAMMLDSMDRYLTPAQKSEFLDSVNSTLGSEV